MLCDFAFFMKGRSFWSTSYMLAFSGVTWPSWMGTILTSEPVFGSRRDLVLGDCRLKSSEVGRSGVRRGAAWFILWLTYTRRRKGEKKLLWVRVQHIAIMSGDEEAQEQTIADDLVVTKYKMGAEIANREWRSLNHLVSGATSSIWSQLAVSAIETAAVPCASAVAGWDRLRLRAFAFTKEILNLPSK